MAAAESATTSTRQPAMRFFIPALRSVGLLLICSGLASCRPELVRQGKIPGGNRRDFGRSELPFWYPLTGYEEQVLARAGQAKSVTGKDLIELGLLGAGDARSQPRGKRLLNKVERFVRWARKESAAEKDPRKRAEWLHRQMHARFLSRGGKDLRGYDAEESRLSRLLARGRYNCISSSLLYVALARYLGLSAWGVILPSHVFVEIRLPDGSRIDVETTSAAGFGLRHDAAFYKEQAAQWSQERGLKPSTFQQYQKRQIVSPLDLVARNMNNQHTAQGRMRPEDRNRLTEMRAFLTPKAREAVRNLLVLYSWEHQYLADVGDHAEAVRMHRQTAALTGPAVAGAKADAQVAELEAWNATYYAAALGKIREWDEALAWVDKGLGMLPAGSEDADSIRSNAMAVVHERLTELVSQHSEFAAAEKLQKRYESICRQVPWCRDGLSWLHARWAIHLFERKQWGQALDRFGAELDLARQSDRPRVLANISAAYGNWAIERHQAGDRDGAIALLRQCMARVPSLDRCAELIERLEP